MSAASKNPKGQDFSKRDGLGIWKKIKSLLQNRQLRGHNTW